MEIHYGQIVIDGIIQSVRYFWHIYLLIIIVVFVKVGFALYKRYRLGRAGMFEIDKMTGDEFEQYLVGLFRRLGYRAQIVGSHKGDYGADLIIEKDGIRTAVQEKRHNDHVGVKAVREVYGALPMYNCTEALVVTNNYFTNQAKQLARADKVVLWDRDELTKKILSTVESNTT